MKIAIVAGARPNFMKVAPILHAVDCHRSLDATLIHTGQHYDKNLSDVFFDQLNIKTPDVCLDVGGGSHAEQTAKIMIGVESALLEGPPSGVRFDRVVVVGDVNSTMAAAVAAAKLGFPVSHVEAGLRSFDRTMPEEINRILTDSVSDQLFVSEPSGVVNLRREGHCDDQIHLVGNVMIDTLRRLLPRAKELDAVSDLGLCHGEYGVVTMHRPSNVDDKQTLQSILKVLVAVSKELPLVFPIHPRTAGAMHRFGLFGMIEREPGVKQLKPVGYLEFLAMTSSAKVIVTDSGGLQEESTALGIPCLTMRANTERPITLQQGSSTLVGSDADVLAEQLRLVLSGGYRAGSCPALWDGKAAERIVSLWA